jgi:hypothetical protein
MPDDATPRFAPDDPAPAKAAAHRADWRADTPGAAGNRSVLRVVTLFALLAVGGVLVGIFAYWLRSKPQPRLVSVPVGEYGPGWPGNPSARRDAELLAGYFTGRSEVQFDAQQQDKFRTLLRGLPARGDQPLVLHVTALAAARDDKLCLIPGTTDRDDPGDWVAVDDLLDAVKDCPAKSKLLVLDLAHPVADPFSGILRDDAADRLDALLTARQRAGTLPFPVLTPCGPGETSLPADPERCSGFAFYLAEGLRGAADGYRPGRTDAKDRDDEVTVSELAAFLAARVPRWARTAHDRRQTPRLYGPPENGPVFRYPKDPPHPPDKPDQPDPYPQWLTDGWKVRDEARKAGADRGLPDPFARLTAGLVRAERDWLRSGDADRAGRNWGPTRDDWQSALQVSARAGRAADVFAKATDAVGRYRLTVARRGRPAPPEWATPLDNYLVAKAAAVPGKPDESAKFKEAWLQKVQPDKGPENLRDAAAGLWERSLLPPQTPERAQARAAALDDLNLDRAYSETLLLRSLAGWDDWRQRLAQYPQEPVAALLRAEDELSRVLALGPDGFELVQGRLDAARTAYRQGQENLFRGSFEQVQRGGAQLAEAAAGFADARKALVRWQEGREKLAAAVAVLIDTMPAALLDEKTAFDGWVTAVRAATDLAEQTDPGQVEAAARELSRVLPAMPDPFAPPPGGKDPAKPPPAGRPADLLPLVRLAAGRTLPADSRRAACEAVRSDAARFHEKARELDRKDDEARDQTVNPAQAEEKGRVGEGELAVRRARASFELLRLAGYAKAGELRPLVDGLTPETADFEAVGRRLRKAWAEELPEQARAAAAAGRWAEADRIARVTPPGATDLRPAVPVAELRVVGLSAAQQAARAYKRWARDQMGEDQKLRPRPAGAAELYEKFYETVSQDPDLGPD